MAKKAKKDGNKEITINNRRARYDYELLELYEAGMVLMGSEVKSLRTGQATIGEAFARFKSGELWLEAMHIPVYTEASYNNHDPHRSRKLLLNKQELSQIKKDVERKGLTIVPVKLYFKAGWVKLQIAVGRGKKNYDKRKDEAKRDAKRQMESYR